jgi:glycosyltransferase involved in cell wall biosynthesis
VDCTTILRQDFVSGIQRVLIDFASENSSITPIVWSFKKGNFETLSKFPKREMLHKSPLKRFFIIALLSPLLNIGTRILHRYRRQIMKIEIIRHYASKLYAAVHVKESFGDWRRMINGEIKNLKNEDVFILIDIPTGKKYKKNLIDYLKNAPIQKIAYVHDLIPLDYPEFWKRNEYTKVKEDFVEYLECLEYIDILISNSLHTSRRFQRYLNDSGLEKQKTIKHKIKTVYPSSKLVSLSKNPAIKKYFEQREVNSFLLVGNFDIRKNFLEVLKAFREISEPFVLRIVSPSNLFLNSEIQSILNEIVGRDQVELQLFDQISDRDLSILYAKSHFVLVPSLAEGFGIPIIEGLAFNCVVVAARNSSMTELIDKFNLNSVNTNTSSEWKDAITMALGGTLPLNQADFDHTLFTPQQFQIELLSVVQTTAMKVGQD